MSINTAPNWFVLLAFFALAAVVFVWFWLAVRAARDIDGRGGPGWVVGLLILLLPPVGLGAWLVLRELWSWTRPPDHHESPPTTPQERPR